jgi:hypothetical protein
MKRLLTLACLRVSSYLRQLSISFFFCFGCFLVCSSSLGVFGYAEGRPQL